MEPTVAVITANLGAFEKEVKNIEQVRPHDFYLFTDKNFPPRHCAMTPRLQARIVKMFGWQMVPSHQIYIWVDSSFSMAQPDTVSWFIEQLGSSDAAFLRHPTRRNIQNEADYIKMRISNNCPYLTPRYANELIEEQLAEIKGDKWFHDHILLASTAFVYYLNERTEALFKEWWYHTSRYHQVDQLSLPYALFKSKCKFNIIEENYYKTPYLSYTRRK